MKKEVIGLKFGRLTPIEYDHMEIRGVNNSRFHFYKCICDCGNEAVVNKTYLLTGDTKSCGCLYIEKAKTMNKRYRNSGHKKNIEHGEMLKEDAMIRTTHNIVITEHEE